MNDKVGDLLIRIKNGYMASREEVVANYSKLNVAILKLLVQEGFIADFRADDGKLTIALKFKTSESTTKKTPVLSGVKRVSKPGRRVYSSVGNLPRVLNGLGIAIISTPKGVMTDKQARRESVGGEVMALVW